MGSIDVYESLPRQYAMAYGNNTHSASFDEMLHVGLECFNLNVHRVISDASSDRFTGRIFLLLCLLLNSSILVLRLATTSPPNSRIPLGRHTAANAP